MRAVHITAFGGSENLQIVECPTPTPKANEVLIKVAAAGLNRADIAQRKGHYPAPEGTPQDIPGLEVSGTIAACGSAVSEWQIGDEVCALLPGGGYAEYVCIDAGSCFAKPLNFSLVDAASLPETLLTVWQNIFQIGQLQKGQTVLIYGGSGGIGSMAIQLVNLFGAKAITLASSAEKIAYCQKLGAELVINYKEKDLEEVLRQNSIDLILDSVGGDYLNTNINLLKPEGKLVYINAMAGGLPGLNIFKMMQKRLIITGSTLRSRTYAHKRALIADMLKCGMPLVDSNKFQNTVTKRFPFTQATQAHQLMDSRNFTGKILLEF